MTEEKPLIIKADAGTYLVEKIEEDQNLTGAAKNKNILKGRILDIGGNRDHDHGGKLIATRKVGDIIWFLHYEQDYDWFKENGRKYFVVLFNDCRAYVG